MALAEIFRPERSYVWPFTMRLTLHAFTYLTPLLLLIVVSLQPWEEPNLLFFDVIVAAEVAPECCSVAYGFMSQLGILIWTTTAAACLFSGVLMAINGFPKSLTGFAIAAGILTGWLAIDDAFLLHEKVFPTLGIPQGAVLLIYISATLFYVIKSWKIIVHSDLLLLSAAGITFIASVGIDLILDTPNWVHLEDSAKFFGICCWASFHIATLLKIMAVKQIYHADN